MKFISEKEIKREGLYSKVYETDAPFNVDRIINTIKQYENDSAVFFECRCSTFTESGNTTEREYNDIESLKEMYDYPNPSIRVRAIYIDPKDMSYKYSISMANNAREFSFSINNDLADYVKKQVELKKMTKESDEKKSFDNQVDKSNSYQK